MSCPDWKKTRPSKVPTMVLWETANSLDDNCLSYLPFPLLMPTYVADNQWQRTLLKISLNRATRNALSPYSKGGKHLPSSSFPFLFKTEWLSWAFETLLYYFISIPLAMWVLPRYGLLGKSSAAEQLYFSGYTFTIGILFSWHSKVI